MKETFDFGDALYFLRQGEELKRLSWGDGTILELDNDKLVRHSPEETIVYIPNQDDVLAEDWYRL